VGEEPKSLKILEGAKEYKSYPQRKSEKITPKGPRPFFSLKPLKTAISSTFF